MSCPYPGIWGSTLPQKMLPQIWREVGSYLIQVYKPCHYAFIEPFKLHPKSMAYLYKVFDHLFSCGWAYGFTLTPLPPQTLPQTCESWLKSYLMQVCKSCNYALVEALEPLKLHPMSMSYIYEVYEHLSRFWMGIWLHTHTVTTTAASPDLWKLGEILPDASVHTMALRLGWGCRT